MDLLGYLTFQPRIWGLLGRKKDQKKLIKDLFGEYEVIVVDSDRNLPNGGFA